ncbi:MAG: tripartite tricarboxylate transporter TctB family protein [Burkholderiales bacterium]|nr:tripartite tricarboxylate transporter TctB family protein [Burkholderiales bacterium]
MKIKSQKDFWSGLMFIVIGIVFAVGATNYSFGSSARPGPAYFPFGLGILLALLGGLVLFKALVIEVEGGDPIGYWGFKSAAFVLVAVVLFGIAIPVLGMGLALPLLIIVGSLGSGEFSLKEALISSVVITAFSWLVFVEGLGLTIPVWPTFLGS